MKWVSYSDLTPYRSILSSEIAICPGTDVPVSGRNRRGNPVSETDDGKYLHSKYHKENKTYRNYTGKWKYDAVSEEELFEKVCKIIPLVASKKFPVAKFTNIANVLSGEKLIVVYCFPFGPSPREVKNILTRQGLKNIYWSSNKYYRF